MRGNKLQQAVVRQPVRSSLPWVRLIGVGVVAATLIICVAVWLTPLDDEASDIPSSVTAASKEQIQPLPSGAGLVAKSDATRSVILRLPRTPEEFDVEQLQNELRTVANQLTTDYPNDPGSWHFAGQTFSELKQSERAEECWKKCLEMSPLYLGPYVGYASMLMEKGRDSEAAEVLLQAEELGAQSPELTLKLGEAYENLGQLDEAAKVVEKGLAEFPDDDALHLLNGRVQTQLGQLENAEKSLRKVIELRGASEAVMVALTTVLVRQGRRDEAVQLRGELAELKKPLDYTEDRFQDDYHAALRDIASGIMVAVGSLAQQHARLSQAEAFYLRCLSLDPTNLQGYQGLQSLLMNQARYADARQVVERLIELEPKSVVHHVNLASIAMQLADASLAESTLKQAEALDPEGVLAQTSLAKVYLTLQRPEEARKYASIVVERSPNFATYQLLAATHQACGDVAAAQAAFVRAQSLTEQSK